MACKHNVAQHDHKIRQFKRKTNAMESKRNRNRTCSSGVRVSILNISSMSSDEEESPEDELLSESPSLSSVADAGGSCGGTGSCNQNRTAVVTRAGGDWTSFVTPLRSTHSFRRNDG